MCVGVFVDVCVGLNECVNVSVVRRLLCGVCVCAPWSRTDVSDVDVLRSLLCCRQVTRVVLLWVNNHFNDFETDPAMSDFLETFEKLLENQVSDAAPKWIGWHV